MTDLPESLVELARRYGVATEYVDWTGSAHHGRRIHADRRARRPRRARHHGVPARRRTCRTRSRPLVPVAAAGDRRPRGVCVVVLGARHPRRLGAAVDPAGGRVRPDRPASAGKQQGPLRSRRPSRSARPPSSCPPICRWVITSCICNSAPTTSTRPSSSPPHRWSRPRGGHGAWPPSCTASARKDLGA